MQRQKKAGESTRERILEAALPLFAQHGFAGTSTRMVANAAEVNVATLAYYFEDKQGLYTAVVQRLHEDLVVRLPSSFPPGTPSEMIDWLARASWEFARDHRVHIRLLLRNVLDRGQHEDVVIFRWSEPLLVRGEQILGMFLPSWTETRRRLFVLTVMHVIVRFVIEDREQLAQMLGNPRDLDAEISRWVADLMKAQLGLS